MTKKALIILAKGFEEIEAIAVIDILRRAGINLIIAGLGSKIISSTRNLNIITDKTMDQINAKDYDAVILPGGMIGSKNLSHSKKVTDLIKKMHSKNKIVAAICAAPAVVLAPIGILDNKNATCYPGMQNEFNENTAFIDKKVVIDGNLITSQDVGTAMEFALAIVEKIRGKGAAKKIAKQALIN